MLTLPEAIFFDMDGILVDSEALHWESVGDVLSDQLGTHAPRLPPRIGWGDYELWAELKEKYELLGSVKDLTAAREECVLIRMRETPPSPMPKALETLKEWRLSAPELPMWVVSASPLKQMEQSLTSFVDEQGTGLFNGLVSGVDDVPHNKPHPAPYLHASWRSGCAPTHCWIAEDSETGLKAALASGGTVFAVGAHSASDELKSKCEQELNTLESLFNLWSKTLSQRQQSNSLGHIID